MTAVSIIIPTHNRRARILATLDAIALQTIAMSHIEVIVVADGCVDDTVVHLQSETFPFMLKVCEQSGLGPAAARNNGAAAAAGELLIFIDDDIEVVPNFVAAHLAAHETARATVAVGHLPMLPTDAPNFFEQGIRSWWDGKFFDMRQPGYRFSYDDLFSGNFSIAASFFTQVQGFNVDLWCHEDYELGLRLLEAGATFVYAAAATGVHHDKTDLARSLRRHYAEGKADVYLVKKYPQLAMQLPISVASYSFLSRGLRFLTFKQPAIGDKVAGFLLRRLSRLERMWLRGAWEYIFYHLHDYWYWRGVADHVENPQDVSQFFTQVDADVPPRIPELMIDLADGLETAVSILDQKRPSSLRLTFQNNLICDIPAEIGKEKLRGDHLQRMLALHLSGKTLSAMGMGKAQNGRSVPFDPNQPLISPERVDDDEWTTEQYFTAAKKVIEIELTEPLFPIEIGSVTGLHALVRYQGQPINWITLIGQEDKIISVETVQQAIGEQIGWSIVPFALHPAPIRSVAETPSITVIVCTRDRADQLEGCLTALLAQTYANFEIIVVDNASKTGATADVAARLPVRYVREDRPGLDWARNRGIAESDSDIIAFTDDDARPDAGWLQAIATAFAEPEVMAVSGPAVAAELDTTAQNLFEFGYGGMSHGFRRRIVRRRELAELELLWASSYGVGANMAFRRTLFDDIDLFDVALDVGTPSQGGGDVEMLHRVVANNHTLVYEPNALVWHQHRRSDVDFEKLVRDNGRSFGCYLLTCARNRTVSKRVIFSFALKSWFWGWIVSRLRQPNGFPRKFVWLELIAFLGSPLAYRRARQQAAHIAQSKLSSGTDVTPTVTSVNQIGAYTPTSTKSCR